MPRRRRVASLIWVDRARGPNSPWQTAASAKETEIGDICYRESYPNSWTSYPVAERKTGITGCQFRARRMGLGPLCRLPYEKAEAEPSGA